MRIKVLVTCDVQVEITDVGNPTTPIGELYQRGKQAAENRLKHSLENVEPINCAFQLKAMESSIVVIDEK